jgi:hypothetical protein
MHISRHSGLQKNVDKKPTPFGLFPVKRLRGEEPPASVFALRPAGFLRARAETASDSTVRDAPNAAPAPADREKRTGPQRRGMYPNFLGVAGTGNDAPEKTAATPSSRSEGDGNKEMGIGAIRGCWQAPMDVFGLMRSRATESTPALD